MIFRVLIGVCLILIPASTMAQMVDNGGTTAPADTSAFGQSQPFTNATTTFDGVDFNLVRLISDPTENAEYRLIGNLVNTGDQELEILFFMPAPLLLDELGNTFVIATRSGIEACRYRDGGNWTNDIRRCDNDFNVLAASRLAPEVPVTFSLGFAPSEDNYVAELAELANTATVRLHFVYSSDKFKTRNVAEIVVPAVPLPR